MKTTKKENIRLEITYGGYYNRSIRLTEETQIQDLEYLKNEIKDHMPDTLDMEIVWDVEHTCSFCGYGWEEEEGGSPLCCNEAIEEWKKQNENNK